MNKSNARAVWKSILRHHPFFREGGMFGFDFRTFHVSDPYACAILKRAVALVQS